jgi:hypothetical protein
MELDERARERQNAYLAAYDGLMGDKRTQRAFAGIIEGINGGESLCASVIARFSP